MNLLGSTLSDHLLQSRWDSPADLEVGDAAGLETWFGNLRHEVAPTAALAKDRLSRRLRATNPGFAGLLPPPCARP